MKKMSVTNCFGYKCGHAIADLIENVYDVPSIDIYRCSNIFNFYIIESFMNAYQQNKFVNNVLNIGNENEITILELAKIIINITKSYSKIVHLEPLKDGVMTLRRPDIGKMKTLLNLDLTAIEQRISNVLNSELFLNLNQIKLSHNA